MVGFVLPRVVANGGIEYHSYSRGVWGQFILAKCAFITSACRVRNAPCQAAYRVVSGTFVVRISDASRQRGDCVDFAFCRDDLRRIEEVSCPGKGQLTISGKHFFRPIYGNGNKEAARG